MTVQHGFYKFAMLMRIISVLNIICIRTSRSSDICENMGSVGCSTKLKHALTTPPIKKRNSASQRCPLTKCDVASNMLPCSCKHLQECDVRVCTAAIRPNYPTSNYFLVESYSTGAKHILIPGASYSSQHVSGCAEK